jgi:MFS family permease
MSAAPPAAATLVTLGLAQTLAWASTFYLPAVLAEAMAAELGLATSTVFAAFSVALVVAAAVGPATGRWIDRHGGHRILGATSPAFALGLALLSQVQGPWTLFGAWAWLGLAMGAGLYEAAFASLVRLYGQGARRAITGITLIAGFASTVGWPLSALMQAHGGWRGACLGWACLHLVLGWPLNSRLPRVQPSATQADAAPLAPADTAQATPAVRPHPAWVTASLAGVFAVAAFTGAAMGTHLPRLLQLAGASLAAAVAAGALIGPAQVGARLAEITLLRHQHPLWTARAAVLTHPLGVALLLAGGAPLAVAFTLLHGAGNGVLTIVKGTLPLSLFGAEGYGQRQGWLLMPARVAQALAPWLFGLALDRWGVQALTLTAAGGLASLLALGLLRR